MTIRETTITRRFKYNSVMLADPSPSMSLEQVKAFYATQFPELLNSTVEGPDTKGTVTTYTFQRAVGTKG